MAAGENSCLMHDVQLELNSTKLLLRSLKLYRSFNCLV